MSVLWLFLRVCIWLALFCVSMVSVQMSLLDEWEGVLPEGYEWLGYFSTFLVVAFWITMIVHLISKWVEALSV